MLSAVERFVASEHSGTDALLGSVNRYHGQEEVRDLSIARAMPPDAWVEPSAHNT
ncbi:MAG: hypothetical protein WA988_17950 [Candidatus Nanopelagicales bacterium]|jgi:hypothetical protein